MKKKSIFAGLGVIFLLVVIVAGVYFSKRNATEATIGMPKYYLSAETAQKRTVKQIIDTKGTFESNDASDITVPFTGKIETIAVEVGDKVMAGDTIMAMSLSEIDNAIRDATLAMKQAELNSEAQRNGSALEIAFQNAEKEMAQEEKALSDAKLLYDSGALSAYAYEDAKRSYENISYTYQIAFDSLSERTYRQASLDLAVEEAKNRLEDLEKDKAKAKVVAPINGTVTSIDASEFDEVSQGQMVAHIETTDDLKVITYIGEYDIDDVALDQKATITGVGSSAKVYKGHVSHIGETAVITSVGQSTERSVEVVIDLDEATTFKPNFTADVSLLVAEGEEVLTVPYEAIVYRDNFPYVFTSLDGVVKMHSVAIGVRGELYVEIITDSIKSGDQVILEPPSTLEEGDAVEILGEVL